MKLKKLLKEISGYQIKGSPDVVITGVSANSKSIAPGHLFIAKRGKMHDGGYYIPEAIEAGASAIVTDLFDPALKQVVQVIHPKAASLEAALAAGYHRYPSRELLMVGITGTNGKTTTSFMVKSLLERFVGSCGLIGTIEYLVGMHRYQATHTTPDAAANQKMLREMVSQGCRSAVMEVTSHALDQGRVDKIDFDIAIFSNLTQDHLDYHGTMENYCLAKNRLFHQLREGGNEKSTPKWAIVNQDSPWTPQILQGCSANILSYGIDKPAELQAAQVSLEQHGTRSQVTYQGKKVECFWPFVGRFNVYNCLAAMAAALTRQIPLEEIAHHMAQLSPVRGRLEPVKNSLGLQIFVDFAHSGDALINVLAALKEVQRTGRLLVVFGCGGDRDRNKRRKMAEACEHYADLCFVTSDNPRSEDPMKICEEVVQGFTRKGIYRIEVDRRVAIQKALELARPEDVLLIAGRGHESYQIFAHQRVEFDDCQVAADLCTQLASHHL